MTRLLYVALKESLPGSHGGAVHVLEVSRQLARRGHELTVVVQPRAGEVEREHGEGYEIRRIPVQSNYLLYRAEPALAELIQSFNPAVVMERYYNFAGAGIKAAERAGLPSLLEVNAPMIDPPGTLKHSADRLMLGWMRRRALEQGQAAMRIVTPLAATIPPEIDRSKIREIAWGANVELFDPARLDPARLQALRARINPKARRVVTFLGSFRPWHGVREFVQVARELAAARDDLLFLMIGAGELLPEIQAFVAREHLEERIILTGAIDYADVPYYLGVSDIGVAPFNPSVHPPLRVGFYWSPLKVHEYMAMALPVVTIDVAGLNQIARNGQEALLYPEGDLGGLRAAILKLADDPALARRLGRAGRARVVEYFSWQKHAELLEQVLTESLQVRIRA